jgi:hypothetical protein
MTTLQFQVSLYNRRMENEQKIAAVLKKYPNLVDDLKELQLQETDLFCIKQYDYGMENIKAGQDITTETGKRLALLALTFRLNEKVQRLFSLLLKTDQPLNEVAGNEPLVDSFEDLSLLAKIAQLVYNDKWR